METVTLTRTNKRPLAFIGEELASDTTKDHNSTRWQKVSVYRTDKGKIVVGIGNITCWQDESDYYSAEVFDDLSTSMTYIEEHAERLAPDLAAKLNISETI